MNLTPWIPWLTVTALWAIACGVATVGQALVDELRNANDRRDRIAAALEKLAAQKEAPNE